MLNHNFQGSRNLPWNLPYVCCLSKKNLAFSVACSGKARSILGLVLPQGPSLVDPLAAASVEDLEAHTVTWHKKAIRSGDRITYSL